MRRAPGVMLLAFLLPRLIFAQAAPRKFDPARDQAPGATTRLVAGTPVRLLLLESLSSKTARIGSTVKARVLGDVKVGDLVVIANGASATATVRTGKPARRLLRAGLLVLNVDTVTLLNGQQAPLRGMTSETARPAISGREMTDLVVDTRLLALPLLPLFLFLHGNEAVTPKGTVLEATIDADVLLPRNLLEAAQPSPAEPRHGPASVTFYYPEFAAGSSVDVWVGTTRVAKLKSGGKLLMTLPPGRYFLRTSDSKRVTPTELDLDAGDEAYVSVTAGHDLWPVVHDVGEVQAEDTSPANAQQVLDVAGLDPRALQADVRPVPRPVRSHALGRRKVEVGIDTGAYMIEQSASLESTGTLSSSPGRGSLIALDAAFGITPHLAAQFGTGFAAYQNSGYWRPEEPHNPYLATADVLSFRGGLRYEFRNEQFRLRPYLGGGVTSTTFANVRKAVAELCLPAGCVTPAPELFHGTKVAPYFDTGINFMLRPSWGLRVGATAHPLSRGTGASDTSMVTPDPNARSHFWHTQLYLGVLHRWK